MGMLLLQAAAEVLVTKHYLLPYLLQQLHSVMCY
jgi:hypothetical protein